MTHNHRNNNNKQYNYSLTLIINLLTNKQMKKSTFFKTLLVAAGLLGGSSAWAEATVVYGRALTADAENGYTAWSAENDIKAGAWVASKGSLSIDATRGLKCAQQRGSALATNSSEISITENAIVTIDAVWNTGYASGGDGENNAFTIGNNIEIRAYTYNQFGKVYINGEEYATISNACGKDNGNRDHDPWTIHIVVNTATNKITAFTILGANGTKKASYTLDGEISLAAGTTYNSLSLAHNRTKGNNAAEACYLTSILITEEAQVITNADYTVNYKLGEDIIKSEEGTSPIGTVISAVLPFTKDEVKYYAADGATTSMELVDGTNVLNVNLRLAETFNYTVKSSTGATISSGSKYEGETVNYTYPRYVLNGTTLYQSHAQGSEFKGSFTLTENNQIKTITYYVTDKTNVFAYIEGEDIDGVTVNTSSSNVGIRASSAAVADGTGVKIMTLPAGTYKFTIGEFMSRSNYDGTVTLNFGGQSFSYKSTTTNLSESTSADSYTITSPTDLNFTVADNGHLDYLIIEKTGEIANITSPTGYATFSSKYALDFTDVTALTAYTATACDGETVTLTKVTGTVAANTGLVIKGETANIPVVATGDAQAGNLLFALDGSYSTLNAAASGTNYVLSVQDDKAVFAPIGATGAPVTAGHAALFVPEASSAKLRLVFADELANGINGVTAVSNADAAIYNLSGQRVNAAYKGIVIKNGKKYLNK